MKTTSIISMLALAAATLAVTAPSCSKKDNPAPEIQTPDEPEDEGTPLPDPSEAKFAELQEEALEKMTTIKKTNAADYTSGFVAIIDMKKGSRVRFGVLCVDKQNGDKVSGDFETALTEIYDRGDMLLANRPSMGKNSMGKIVPLVTGGQFLASLKQGDEALEIPCGFEVQAPFSAGNFAPISGYDPDKPVPAPFEYALYSPTDDKMKLWKSSDGNATWELMQWDPQSFGFEGAFLGRQYSRDIVDNKFVYDDFYEVTTPLRRWTAIGRFYVHDGASTKIKVSVPDGYNAQNAKVYLAYEGEQHLLAELYSYDAAGKHFTEPDGFVPVGKKVHAIFLSESGGKFAYGIKTVTVTANAEIAFKHKDLATIEPDDLAKKVNELD